MNEETDAKWSDVCSRWDTSGYASLTRQERTWLNIRSLIDSTENGGLVSYFYNSGADTLGDCLEDLRLLGADEVRTEVERVCALFGGVVPASIEARNEQINAWSEDGGIDELLEDVDETLMPLMSDLERRLSKYLLHHGQET